MILPGEVLRQEEPTSSFMQAVSCARFLVFFVALTAGCTSIGFHNQAVREEVDFGPPDTLSVCAYLDDGISEDSARALIDDAWRDEAPLYRLNIRVARAQYWPRPAFQYAGIMKALIREPLEAPCDRILALVGRNAGDFAWNLLPLPEILGAVDDETLTHGYAVARLATLNQVFMPPVSAVRHEIYHLLGCYEHFSMAHCYKQISELKEWRRVHRSAFFPAFDSIRKRILGSRDEVNVRLLGAAAGTSSALGSR